MSKRPSVALVAEAASWIAEQLSEEGVIIGDELVELLLNFEWDSLERGVDPDDRAALVAAVCERSTAESVQIGPTPAMMLDGAQSPAIDGVPPDLVERVLSWEDEFLGLAGIQRG
jgi:hypothetical protein